MTEQSGAPIGVLALQGDFAAHGRVLESVAQPWIEVRKPEELEQVAGLILPGGESTTLLRLMDRGGMQDALRQFHAARRPMFGTCAGAILLATEVTHPAQKSLGLLDITVERNSYGRQIDSFETQGQYHNGSGTPRSLDMVFIRAPRIVRVGPNVQVLARCQGDPVLVACDHILAATFHPEMTRDTAVHQLFVSMCRATR